MCPSAWALSVNYKSTGRSTFAMYWGTVLGSGTYKWSNKPGNICRTIDTLNYRTEYRLFLAKMQQNSECLPNEPLKNLQNQCVKQMNKRGKLPNQRASKYLPNERRNLPNQKASDYLPNERGNLPKQQAWQYELNNKWKWKLAETTGLEVLNLPNE